MTTIKTLNNARNVHLRAYNLVALEMGHVKDHCSKTNEDVRSKLVAVKAE